MIVSPKSASIIESLLSEIEVYMGRFDNDRRGIFGTLSLSEYRRGSLGLSSCSLRSWQDRERSISQAMVMVVAGMLLLLLLPVVVDLSGKFIVSCD
jgi:hypothetical protein